MNKIFEFADVFTIEEFIKYCRDYMFVNDDGTGYYANPPYESDILARPSDVLIGLIPHGYTHVAWYNK